MRLAMVSRPLAETDLRLARQMGMTDVVTTVPGVTMGPEREQGPALRYEDLLELRNRVEAQGLRLSVIEGYQLSDRITLGMPGREDDMVKVCESIRNMGRAGMPRVVIPDAIPYFGSQKFSLRISAISEVACHCSRKLFTTKARPTWPKPCGPIRTLATTEIGRASCRERV